MASVLESGLPALGIECDSDIVEYLLELLESEGIDACAEWIAGASADCDSSKARALAEEAFTALKNNSTSSVSEISVADALQHVDIALAAAKAAAECPKSSSLNTSAWDRSVELDKDVKREIVERYASVELQTLHLDENGQLYASGVSLRDLDDDVALPVNDNAARVKKEQQERRMMQKQQHIDAQAKQQLHKLKQQEREERERLRCQKKERHK
ncbi:hypothetical protein BBOV_II005810 [Babesia bovis T2Bo]|uniref:Coiled-coil domain-containing protein 43 n=1 Tax=Babesia bovis TaxID=5865 RepID=A7AUC1_BABBO|nr:hypothetical protein BBOV_II005810 [Babesia bovis T2Bo]EDO06532.1 hypothetical protein BBOV_II005810 [Babesia bovis T2Bo]|eukprot:XP_001610100.1 hypothetical protein [Babesia bovis T2Bo]